MAEDFDPARLSADKRARYGELVQEVASVLDGERDTTARMATVSSMLHHAFDTYFWTGFYVVDPDKGNELRVGPYQGTLGCLRIPFGRGVCGAAAAERRTVIVENVDAFPGHIACDSRSRSEIVTPVFDPAGRLIAVFDVDSDRPAAFDQTDAHGIETILRRVFSQ
jgi:GAF domain-containing protein